MVLRVACWFTHAHQRTHTHKRTHKYTEDIQKWQWRARPDNGWKWRTRQMGALSCELGAWDIGHGIRKRALRFLELHTIKSPWQLKLPSDPWPPTASQSLESSFLALLRTLVKLKTNCSRGSRAASAHRTSCFGSQKVEGHRMWVNCGQSCRTIDWQPVHFSFHVRNNRTLFSCYNPNRRHYLDVNGFPTKSICGESKTLTKLIRSQKFRKYQKQKNVGKSNKLCINK